MIEKYEIGDQEIILSKVMDGKYKDQELFEAGDVICRWEDVEEEIRYAVIWASHFTLNNMHKYAESETRNTQIGCDTYQNYLKFMEGKQDE